MNDREKLIRFLIIVAIVYCIVIVLSVISDIREKGYQFNGKLDKIEYNEKGTPLITVNGEKYALSTGWRFNEKMNVGDSIVKVKGSLVYKLIKQKTREVLFSNDKNK